MTSDELKSKIEADFKEKIQSVSISAQKEVLVVVKPEAYLSLCQDLKAKPDYDFKHLSCLTAIDYPKDNKITVVCHLWSYQKCHQLTVKLEVDRANPKAPTVENI